ncbi:superoxide dismutase, partial [Teratosphaeria destructans]
MDTPDLNSWPAKLVLRVGRKFRSNKSFTQDAINKNNARQEARRQKLREEHARKNGYQLRRSTDTRNPGDEVNELGERDYSVFSEATTLVPDHTDMLHGLAHHDSFDSLLDAIQAQDRSHDPYADPEKLRLLSEKHERMIDSLPDDIWKRIADFLTPADAAHLALTNKPLLTKLGNEPILALALDINRHHRITFLRHMDRHLPRHLLCMPCGRYHLRLRPGKETYRADYVNNPLVQCPLIKASVLPRMRLTHGRELPYSFVQLALRTAHSPAHGIAPD